MRAVDHGADRETHRECVLADLHEEVQWNGFLEAPGEAGPGPAVTPARFLLVLGLLCSGFDSHADLKAVFVFDEKVLSMRLPSFRYGILTSVDDRSRRIAVSFPAVPFDTGEKTITPHLELVMEPVDPDLDGLDYYLHYAAHYAEATGSTVTADEVGVPHLAPKLPDSHQGRLLFTDGASRSHKAILITSIGDGVGVVVFLDMPSESDEENEAESSAIMQSIGFEE